MPQRATDRERASATIALLAPLDAGDAAALAAAGLIRGHRPGAFIAREATPATRCTPCCRAACGSR